MINIEVQYFRGCSNSQKMIDNVKTAITELDSRVKYIEIRVETFEKAREIKFRG